MGPTLQNNLKPPPEASNVVKQKKHDGCTSFLHTETRDTCPTLWPMSPSHSIQLYHQILELEKIEWVIDSWLQGAPLPVINCYNWIY